VDGRHRQRLTTTRAGGAADAHVAAVRRFNRFYTERIGALGEHDMDTPFTLTEARVLHELASRERPSASELGRQLRLDAGYLSRILRSFERKRMLERARSAHDARRSELRLTPHGREAFAALNARTQADIAALLDRLPARDRLQIVRAMETIERLLGRDGSPAPAQSARRGNGRSR
jgi:DNA-binding MarR family transcriptional regulator